MVKQIIVLDFSSNGQVYTFEFDEMVYSNNAIIDFFDAVNEEYDLHLKESECQWMIYDEITINMKR